MVSCSPPTSPRRCSSTSASAFPTRSTAARSRSGEGRDPEEVEDLQSRLDHRPSRETVVLLPLVIWLALTGLAALIWRAPGARVALRLLGARGRLGAADPPPARRASCRTARLRPRRRPRGPGARLLTDRALSPCAGLALAAGSPSRLTRSTSIAGSPLTALSVLGPNPGAGVRFFGIGNELEAILTTLTLIGCGAGWRPARSRPAPRPRSGSSGSRSLAAAAFAPGRFGADVGAAIVLGVGAATAAVIALGSNGGGRSWSSRAAARRRSWPCSCSTRPLAVRT